MSKDAYKTESLLPLLPLTPSPLLTELVPTHRYTKALARQLTNHQSFGCLARTRRASFPCPMPHSLCLLLALLACLPSQQLHALFPFLGSQIIVGPPVEPIGCTHSPLRVLSPLSPFSPFFFFLPSHRPLAAKCAPTILPADI